MLSKLNPKQREAVEHTDGPLLILAGAGSGKTRVLTYRMAYLLNEKKIRPWNLFAVTFTNKAAGEMRERVEKLLGVSSRDLWVSTFHSSCLRILRRHADLLGTKTDFTIYDDRDQLQILTQCVEELKMNPQSTNPKMVAYKINDAKHNSLSVEQFTKRNTDFFGEKVAAVYQLYQKKLQLNQAMDFGDLILNVVLLFRQFPQVLKEYQEKFKYIHVDEYQDTNKCQYELINLLAAAHRNLCVVGDDDQSIYKFRGAEIKNILDFQNDYPDAGIIRLEQNYRSSQNVLKAAGAVVAKNRARMGKTLWTENDEGEKLTLFKGENEGDEARFVVGEMQKRKKDTRYSEMAIFYRTNAQSRPFEDELRRNRIPYIIVGGTKFYDRQEIKDMLAYLKLLVNPADSISLKRVINVPARAIGKTTIEKLEEMALTEGLSLWDVVAGAGTSPLQPAIIAKLNPFVNLLQSLKNDLKQMSLTDFMTHLFDKTGYWKMLVDEKSIEAEGRMENLEELVNVVEEYVARAQENVEEATLEGFLDQASLVSDLDKLDPNADRALLMTFHLAKGLEFPVVFMVGMEEGLFPHSRSFDSEDDIEEERRLCYVGMTRAMKKLYLSFVNHRRIFGTDQYHQPSRFLEEIPEEVIEAIGMEKKESSSWDIDQRVEYDDDAYPRAVSTPASKNQYIDYSYDESLGTRSSAASFNPIKNSNSNFLWDQRSGTFKQGQRVKHPQFGVGIVKASEGKGEEEKLTIAFQGGALKKLLAKYANLVRL